MMATHIIPQAGRQAGRQAGWERKKERKKETTHYNRLRIIFLRQTSFEPVLRSNYQPHMIYDNR